MTHLTETTGKVEGAQEVKDFISMCNSKFNEVITRSDTTNGLPCDYLQYTLYTNNRIGLFLSVKPN